MRKIALEEHYGNAALRQIREEWYARTGFPQAQNPEFAKKVGKLLPDIEEHRLPAMDAAGIDLQVLSFSTPGVQWLTDSEEAVRQAASFNNELAGIVTKHPRRFAAFSTLPMQNPQAAASELERCVKQLGFLGVMIHGHTNGAYLDDPQFRPVWEAAVALDVPIYLHPTDPIPDQIKIYDGHPELLGAAWNWGVETATHVLRIVCGGIFDEFPTARLIIGHMGEMLPYVLNRLDGPFRAGNRGKQKRLPSEYIRENVWLTTTGSLSVPALQCAIQVMGIEHVLFSVDYPFQDSDEAVLFIEGAPLSEADREAICHGNAERILKLA